MKDVKRYAFKGAAGEYVYAPDYDAALSKLAAETLRADTAEADLRTERLRADAAVGDANDAERELAAAEKRVSELRAVLERMLEDDDMPVHWFAQRIDAALDEVRRMNP